MGRCKLCPGVHQCLAFDGPMSPYLFIGEAPGKDENRRGRIFVGKTGQELDRGYLPLAGLHRLGVTIANAIACLPTSAGGKLDLKSPKDRALLDSCANTHLYPLIERMQPRVLIPMGAFACYAVNPEIDLELQHGIPCETPFGIPAFPMYHPALGIHEPKRMLLLRNDWMRLRQYLRGTLPVRVDAFPDPDYAEVRTEADLYGALWGHATEPLACDTESKRGGSPFCLTFSAQPGTGRLIRAERTDLLAVFQRYLCSWRGPILFHNWLYDRPVTQAMGLTISDAQVVDTMLRAFHLGNLPQGLKALAYRELGMAMQDFDDLVSPHSARLVLDYYRQAQAISWPKPEGDLIRGDDGKWKTYTPQGMNTKLKRFFTDVSKNPEKDVFQAWENWEAEQAMIEAELGPWPGKCITHVPFEQTLYYACRDADATRRLYPILQQMRKHVRRKPQQEWRAA